MSSFEGRTVRRAARGRVAALLLVAIVPAIVSACGVRMLGKVYEYEEDVYVALDGSADVIINASIPALVTLRGLDLSLDPLARLDRERLRAAYTSPITEVTRVSRPWRRQGRRFVQIRLHAADIRKLSQAPPLSWSAYELTEKGETYVYRQTVGASAMKPGTLTNVGWTGGELVAFRLHLPSRIVWHNARELETNETSEIARGNILSWEQLLTDRLDGRPIDIEVRMDSQTILHHTLWLFAGAFTAAVLLIGSLIWWTVRRGSRIEDSLIEDSLIH
jgi:hypothetical protein